MHRSVVVIDDSNFLIKQVADFFELEMNFSVIATGRDGNQALELYNKFKPDLITLDVTMPNKNGRTAIVEILKENPEARILMISAVRGPAVQDCINRGAKGYIEKPVKFKDLKFVNNFKRTLEEVFTDKLS